MDSQPERQVDKSTHLIVLGTLLGGALVALFIVLNARTWANNTTDSGLAWSLRGLGFFTVHGGVTGIIFLATVSSFALMGVAFIVRATYRSWGARRISRDL